MQQLLRAGVPEKNIFIDSTDTGASHEYYSHYRSQRTSEQEGRFVTIVALQ